MTDKATKETRVDTLIKFFQNNKFTSTLILFGIIIIGFGKVADSSDSILRKIGIIKSYNVNQSTNRGRFSSALLENAWNRMFWMRAYTERIRLNATPDEKKLAWQKYIDASEKWSSNIMNYYLGLDEYYPNSGKRIILENTIQPKFIKVAHMITALKYSLDTLPKDIAISKIDSIQSLVNDVNPDFYFLIDQPIDNK